MSPAVHPPTTHFRLPLITDSGDHCGRKCEVQTGTGSLEGGCLQAALWTATGDLAAVCCEKHVVYVAKHSVCEYYIILYR
jgi:hypothetical protein